MDRKSRSMQWITGAAFALAAAGAYAAGTDTSSGSRDSTNGASATSEERANPTANGNEAAGNSQASVPRTQKDENQDWNAAPAGAKGRKAARSDKRYDGYDSSDRGKNNADEPTSQPSSGGDGNQASGGQG